MWVSGICVGLLVAGVMKGVGGEAGEHNRLSEAEQKEGWQLLFDGKSGAGWRGYAGPGFPSKGWEIEEGCLKHVGQGGGGDIITAAAYDGFEFSFEWKLAPKANSGVKYLVVLDRELAPGHEYQIVDDVNEKTSVQGSKHQTASFYDVLPATVWREPRPPGQFNESRILVLGNHVEHWLNGSKMLEYELGSEAVRQAVAKSKFRGVKGFGEKVGGHLLLQDHGGEIWFRNLKVRDLSVAAGVR